MFLHTSVIDLCVDVVYMKSDRGVDYISLFAFDERPFVTENLADAIREDHSRCEGILWEKIDDRYQEYCSPSVDMPLLWLISTKRALLWDWVPANLYEWSKVILNWFDADRYCEAHDLSTDECKLIKSDLEFVRKKLASYSKENLKRPFEEDFWGVDNTFNYGWDPDLLPPASRARFDKGLPQIPTPKWIEK
jgi:hypothetical protein